MSGVQQNFNRKHNFFNWIIGKKIIISKIVADRSQSVTDIISMRPIVTGRSQIPAHNIFSAFGGDFEFGLQNSRDFLLPSLRALASTPSFTPNPQTPFSHLAPPFNLAQFLHKSWPTMLNLRIWLQFFRVHNWGRRHCDWTRSRSSDAGASVIHIRDIDIAVQVLLHLISLFLTNIPFSWHLNWLVFN